MGNAIIGKLNGWQRSWVLGSALLFIAAGVYGFMVFPSYDSLDETAVLNHGNRHTLSVALDRLTDEEMAPCRSLQNSGRETELKNCIGQHVSAGIGDKQIAELRQAASVEDQQNQEAVTLAQLLFVPKLLLLWAFSIGAVYAFGVGVAWVRKGF